MGTDIHGVFQKRAGNEWVDIPHNYDHGRDYYLFAILADVRNGFGFAGAEIFTPVKPISEPRGLPADFQVEADTHLLFGMELMDPRRRSYYERWPADPVDPDDNPLEYWLGDHSHSWLLGSEILAYGETLRDTYTEETGVMSLKEYDAWDGKSRPDSYSGAVWGKDLVTVTPETLAEWRASMHFPHAPDKVYVRVRWMVPALPDVAYFFEEVARLVAEHGEVRYVFGFDS
jgi:hypothetical protein